MMVQFVFETCEQAKIEANLKEKFVGVNAPLGELSYGNF